jgi:tetratricopeptide (TPR) repeat protein
MRTISYFFAFPLSLFLVACGGADTTATAVEEAPRVITGAFAPAAQALDKGASAAEVGGLLMQKFSSISDEATGALNMEESRNFAETAQRLADKYPADTLAALPLYRAAEVVRAMNDPKRAAMIYEQIHNNYPTFSKAPEALFMLGFTYDEDLNSLDKAKEIYEKFLKLYPENVFAKATPMLLENLGKTDEEILKNLEAKAAGSSPDVKN